jgi:hypothetical protein
MVAEILSGAVERMGAAGMQTDMAVEAFTRLLVLAEVGLPELDAWLREPLLALAHGRRVRDEPRMRLLVAHGFVAATAGRFGLTAKGLAELGEARAA